MKYVMSYNIKITQYNQLSHKKQKEGQRNAQGVLRAAWHILWPSGLVVHWVKTTQLSKNVEILPIK